jgi:Short C-terminal domain
MPGLLRGMARTAVVAGTATTVSNRVSRRQGQRWAEQDAAYAAPESAAPSSVERLKELAALREQGILTDDEFASEKAKVLRG